MYFYRRFFFLIITIKQVCLYFNEIDRYCTKKSTRVSSSFQTKYHFKKCVKGCDESDFTGTRVCEGFKRSNICGKKVINEYAIYLRRNEKLYSIKYYFSSHASLFHALTCFTCTRNTSGNVRDIFVLLNFVFENSFKS